MDVLVNTLPASARVLDLGAGAGSFAYPSTRAAIIAADLAFPGQTQASTGKVISRANALPFDTASFDVIICNHTMEHFEHLRECVLEIRRVLKPAGDLWVAVPDANSLDDRLYRYLFLGGGHINHFTLDSLIRTLETGTQLVATRYKKLYSGFVYLNPPDREKLPHYPPRAQKLAKIPPRLCRFLLKWFNYLVRRCDRLFGTNSSHYGWGVIFHKDPGPGRGPAGLQEMPSDLNVCFHCGAGHPSESLPPLLRRKGLVRVYACPSCSQENLYAKPFS